MSIYNLTDLLEQQELIQKLKERGHEKLVEALLENESRVYTKKGRLNKSGACRVLGWKPKQLEDALNECREILKKDYGDEESITPPTRGGA
jgi:nucleoside-diphosphate-sugar epimerase